MTAPILARLSAAGATWLDLPVLYPADPFLETAGEDIRRRMFVTEGRTGDRLALRPDFTIPVCLHHIAAGAGPARYVYEGLVFRRHEEGPQGLGGERREAGYEDIGDPATAAADARTLAVALDAVTASGRAALAVRLGDIGLFMAVLSALGLPAAWRMRLRQAFGAPAQMEANLARLAAPPEPPASGGDPELGRLAGARDRDGLVALIADRLAAHGHSPGEGRSAEEIADRYLERRALAETRLDPDTVHTLATWLDLQALLADAPTVLAAFAAERGLDLSAALAPFAARAEALAEAAPSADIRFSAGFGRPLDYYTGMVFDVADRETGAQLAGGGRYDRLMEMLGAKSPTPAVGFSLRLDRLRAGPGESEGAGP